MEFNAQDLEFGFNESRRDRILRTFVRNAYYYHLNEIYSTLKNEYTDWDKPVQNPLSVRDATLEVTTNCVPTAYTFPAVALSVFRQYVYNMLNLYLFYSYLHRFGH